MKAQIERSRTLGRGLQIVILLLCALPILSEPRILAQTAGGTPPPPPKVNSITPHARVKVRRSGRKSVLRKTLDSSISLWIVSNPPTSKVLINGEPRGETDTTGEIEIKLPPGTYSIRVSKEGYITREADVDVLPAPEAQEVQFTLPLALVTLNVVTDPQGAEVYLDDVYKGASGPTGSLLLERVNPSQAHTLRVRKAGYVEQSTPVTANAGQISIKLLPDSVRLAIITDPPEAEVYLNDVYKGTSTQDGSLVIDNVNPNQLHVVRAKKSGFRPQSLQLPPNSSQALIKLSPDPVVLLVKDIKRMVAQDQLIDAYVGYDQLVKDDPDHPELPRLSESILQSLQARSTDRIRQVSYFGLSMPIKEIEEMNKLYEHARQGRVGDEIVDISTKYWSLKLLLAKSDQPALVTEREALLSNARSVLADLSDRNLRNPYLVLDLGWSWWKLNDKSGSQKQFKAAQELRPDWAYPHFALGLVAMNAAENERAKSAKQIAYGLAIDSFTKAIRLKQNFAAAYALQSLSYTSIKRQEEALASGLQGVAVAPQNALAHFALGSAYFEKGKSGYRSSLDELNRALALDGSELSDGNKRSIQQLLIKIKKTIK